MLRIFIALELPDAVKTSLQMQLDALQQALGRGAVRWVKAENIHLTLKFLGDVSVDALDKIKTSTQLAIVEPPFTLKASQLGCFPNLKLPKVIWIGVNGQVGILQALRDRVEAEISPLGFPTESRPFSPHLTLGRVKTRDNRMLDKIQHAIQDTQREEAIEWTVKTVSIMKSTLKPSGAEYAALAHYDLPS